VLEGSVSIRDLESQYQLSLPRDSGFETSLDSFSPACKRYLASATDSIMTATAIRSKKWKATASHE